MDCSLPGSSVHGILEKRILEWVAIRGRAGQTGCAACGFGVRPAGTAVTGPGLADPPRPWGGCSLDGLGREPLGSGATRAEVVTHGSECGSGEARLRQCCWWGAPTISS